ncbi:DUF3043 domain-containing protein [Quadrisphaera setariae]|uniref:DUF3043 domain-containing protein n=1 Tax=Quadrisphaera setariae TaxID=2593304 RepID=A0A5C8Z3U9_9ACTN|nr:DUF3043 domain-containing protein [Quadrisphaera setariae]TXR52775.1 DUF3043 domain-containing protein [Quadrisphaera setariae]
MFGRTKEPPAAAQPAEPSAAQPGQGKGRPTPTRAEREAANRRPLVPTDRRAASASSKEALRAERRRVQQGRINGEEKYLALRDRGPVKRFVRDVVDSRRNLGEYFLPFVLVLLLVQLAVSSSGNNVLFLASYALLYVGLIAVVVDSLLLRRKVRRLVAAKFGDEALFRTGVVGYAVMRALQLRRSRIPKPQVTRGQKVA